MARARLGFLVDAGIVSTLFGNLVLPLYNQLMKITTKTGDNGETSLFGGRRVSKASGFIELVGELDELQAMVGWCKVAICKGCACGHEDFGGSQCDNVICTHIVCTNDNLIKVLDRIMDDIYRMMAIVGFKMQCPKNINPIVEEDVEFLEGEMAGYEEVVMAAGGLNKFVRPGSSEISARLHIARTVCRRVERRVAQMMDGEDVGSGEGEFPVKILKYLNRLSDLLFVMACDRMASI